MDKCITCHKRGKMQGSLQCEKCLNEQVKAINEKYSIKGDVDMRGKVEKLLVEGLNVREIAEKLETSTASVYYHRTKINEEKEGVIQPKKKASSKERDNASISENKRLQRELDESISKVKELEKGLSDEMRASNNTIKMLKETISENSDTRVELLEKEKEALQRRLQEVERDALEKIRENKKLARLERNRHEALYKYMKLTRTENVLEDEEDE